MPDFMLRSRGARRLGHMALSAILLSTTQMMVLSVATPAVAQGAVRTYRFSIAAQSLPQALVRFSGVTGIDVAFNGALPPGARSNGVQGELTSRQALESLLSGTGLAWRFSGENTVVLSVAGAQASPDAAPADGSVALETITVTSGNAASAPYETSSSVSHVSAEQMSRVPPSTVGDVFKGVPGVLAAQGRNGASLNVNIRGLQGMNRVKTTIDGAEHATSTYRGYFGTDNRSYVDPDLIGGIDVGRGPGTGAESAGAIGGVVAMRTLTADDILLPGSNKGARIKTSTASNTTSRPAIGTLKPETGRGDIFGDETWSGSVAAAARNDNFEIVGAFSRRMSGNYFAGKNGPTTYRNELGQRMYYAGGTGPAVNPGEEVFNTSQNVSSGLVKATARWDDGHSLQLGYTYYENTYGEVTPLLVQQNLFRELDLSNTKVRSYTARYRYQPDDNDLVDFRFNLWASDLSELTNYFTAYSSSTYRRYLSPVESLTYGGDATNTSRFQTVWGEIDLTYGGSLSFERSKPGDGYSGTLPINGERQIGRLFTKGEWRPFEWLKLNAGLSYDAWQVADRWNYATVKPSFPVYDPVYPGLSGGGVNPSLGITVSPLEGLQMFASYTQGTRPPSLREYGVGSGAAPNTALKEETSRNIELGMNVKREDVLRDGDRLGLKLAYFNNTVDDYLARDTVPYPPYTPQLTSVNLDKAKFSGIEFQANYDASFVFGEVGATYYDNIEYCKVGKPCQARTLVVTSNSVADYSANYVPPKFMVTATLGARFFEEALTLGTRVTHAQERAIPSSHGQSGDISVVWPKFTTVDLFGSYKFSEHLRLDASVENLTNRFYIDPLAGTRSPAPGTTARISLTARF